MSTHIMRTILFASLLFPGALLFAEEYGTVRTLEGGAQVIGARESQPQEVTLNTPLLEGDTLWTTRSGRLEVFLQDGTRVWFDYDTRLEADRFPNLDPNQPSPFQARLWKGSLLVEIQTSPPSGAAYVISSPSATVQFPSRGLFLLEVESVDRTQVTALEGSCEVTSSGSSVRLAPSQMTYAEYGYAPTPAREGGRTSARTLLAFRDSNLPRPTRGGVSSQYLPDTLNSYSADFDRYGTWSYSGTYGQVWRPSPAYLSVGWSPYYHGRWHHTRWGVTWIPMEAWGWAPSHFGRWIFLGGFWSWVPGHIFSPAWVAWYWGDGWIGWSPWGWDGPSWNHCGWRSVNITNLYVTNITHVVVNHTGPPPVPPIRPQPPLHRPKDRGNPQDFDRGGRGEGIHIQPKDLDDYRKGRVDLGTLKGGLTRPEGNRQGGSRVLGNDEHRSLPPQHRPSEASPPTRPGADRLRPGSEGIRPAPPTRTQPPGRDTRPEISPRPGIEPSPRVQPPARTQPPANEPPTRPAPQPRYEPPARTQPPAYEPPTRPAPQPRYEPPARTQPPAYEPPTRPAPQPRYEPPARTQPPAYEPPTRPAPQPRYEPPARTQPPAYEPPTRPAPQPRYEPPPTRIVPSRTEPRQEYTPPPAPPRQERAPSPQSAPPPPQNEDHKKMKRN